MLFFIICSNEKPNVHISPDGSGILCRRGSAAKIERTAGGNVVKNTNCDAPI